MLGHSANIGGDMDFLQSPPLLRNTFDSDATLQSYIARALPADVAGAIRHDLFELGAYAAQAWLDARSRAPQTPQLTQWNAWGERIDRIETTATWQRGAALTARYGFVAAGHEAHLGALARVDQFCASTSTTSPANSTPARSR
jgi:hypothetical protein